MRLIVATANPHMATHDVHELADYVMNKPIEVHEFAILVKRLKIGRTTSPPTVP
jgi:hypothetical protein